MIMMSFPASFALGYGSIAKPAITSVPLRIFKEGVSVKDIVCKENFLLIIKAKDGTPACVKPETASKLIERGWGAIDESSLVSIDTLSNHYCKNFYAVPENKTYLNTVPVLLMKSDSTACARLTFTISSNYNDCNGPNCQHVLSLGPMLFIRNLHYEKYGDGSFGITQGQDYTHSFKIMTAPGTVDLANYPLGANFTVTYVISPLPNATGFYDQSMPRLACGHYPLAVGYSKDQVNASDFSYINPLGSTCVSSADKLTKVEVSGMDYKDIELRLALLEPEK